MRIHRVNVIQQQKNGGRVTQESPKFEMSSVSHPSESRGSKNFKRGPRDPDHTPLRAICLSLADTCHRPCNYILNLKCLYSPSKNIGDTIHVILNKNLAIANRSRVSCTYNTSRAFYSNSVTLKYRLRITQCHWKRKHWIDHARLTISRVIWRWILSWPWNLIYRLLKIIEADPFESLVTVSYSPFVVTMPLYCIVCLCKI